jgi:hypothetical protein
MATDTIQLLKQGAIRKNNGNGYRFYDALNRASIEELERTFVSMPAHSWSRFNFTFHGTRVMAITKKLVELRQEATDVE